MSDWFRLSENGVLAFCFLTTGNESSDYFVKTKRHWSHYVLGTLSDDPICSQKQNTELAFISRQTRTNYEIQIGNTCKLCSTKDSVCGPLWHRQPPPAEIFTQFQKITMMHFKSFTQKSHLWQLCQAFSPEITFHTSINNAFKIAWCSKILEFVFYWSSPPDYTVPSLKQRKDVPFVLSFLHTKQNFNENTEAMFLLEVWWSKLTNKGVWGTFIRSWCHFLSRQFCYPSVLC